MTTYTISEILRGNPPSDAHGPNKEQLATWLESLENLVAAGVSYYEDDLADLPTASGVTDGVFAVVLNDSTTSNRGIYQEQSDAWVKVAGLPAAFTTTGGVILTAGGTANAITATSNRSWGTGALAEIFLMVVASDNTGAVTVAIDGGTAYDLVTPAGDALSSGQIVTDMLIAFAFDGTDYRLITDVSDGLADGAVTNAKLADKSGLPLVFLFDNKQRAIYDTTGAIGGPAHALYIPRDLYFEQYDSRGIITAANVECSELAGFCKIDLTGSADAQIVYFDTSDNTFKLQAYSAGFSLYAWNDTKIIVFQAWEKGNYKSAIPIDWAERSSEIGLHFRAPIIVEDGFLLVPKFYVSGADLAHAVYAQRNPADGRSYEAFAITDSGTLAVEKLVYDRAAALRGDDDIFVAKFPDTDDTGLRDGAMQVVLARNFGGVVDSPFPLAGRVAGGAVPNQMRMGKTCGELNYLNGSETITAVTDSDLLALGFTYGITGGAGNSAYGGAPFIKPQGGQKAFFRCAIETDADNEFGTVEVFLWDADGFISGQRFTLAMEKKISATAALFSGYAMLHDDATAFVMGSDPVASEALIVTGMQFHASDVPAWWIMRDDFPDRAIEAAYPPDLWAISGRPLPFYPGNVLSRRDRAADAVAVFQSLGGSDGGYLPYVLEGRDQLLIDPARLGASGAFEFGLRNRPDKRLRNAVTTHVAAASQSGTLKVAIIGDSLTFRESPLRTGRKLVNLGLTVEMVGTMECSSGGSNYVGEGREGKEWADYTYEHTDDITPVASGDEATYTAGTETYKRGRNPFLKTPTGDDTTNKPTYIKNSYIFDYAYYLSRFSLSTPDVVIVNLGTNDLRQQDVATALSQVQTGFEIMYNQIREACPDAAIGFATTVYPRTTAGDAAWEEDRWSTLVEALQGLVQAEIDGGDSNVWFLPAYAHMSAETGWSTTTDSTGDGGMQTLSIDDSIHPVDHGREQYAEVLAAFCACIHEGV